MFVGRSRSVDMTDVKMLGVKQTIIPKDALGKYHSNHTLKPTIDDTKRKLYRKQIISLQKFNNKGKQKERNRITKLKQKVRIN